MPHLLIVSDKDIFREETASALTIRSFVENWDRASIYQIVCNDFNSYPSGIVDSHTFHFAHDSILVGSRIVKDNRHKTEAVFVPSAIKNEGEDNSILKQFRALAVGLYQELPYNFYNTEFRVWLKTIKVDAIYTEFTDARTLKLVRKLASVFNVPVLPHFMDDWPSVYLPQFPLLRILNRSFNNRLKRFLRTCDTCFCISESMCQEYCKRYNLDIFVPLMHSVEVYNDYKPLAYNNVIKLLYSGSLYLDRYKTLLLLCEGLNQIKQENFEFNIFCSQKNWDAVSILFNKYSFVNYRGFINQDELLNEIERTDLLVFAESFDAKMLSFTKFSLSTKVPEYLSSGRPILALGNNEQGSIEYLNNHKAAYTITNEKDIVNKVIDVIKGNDYETIMTNAKDLFINNHVKSKQQDRFREYIDKAINRHGASN